jgi:hypothetical protein
MRKHSRTEGTSDQSGSILTAVVATASTRPAALNHALMRRAYMPHPPHRAHWRLAGFRVSPYVFIQSMILSEPALCWEIIALKMCTDAARSSSSAVGTYRELTSLHLSDAGRVFCKHFVSDRV